LWNLFLFLYRCVRWCRSHGPGCSGNIVQC
jgi:hypothetical protein